MFTPAIFLLISVVAGAAILLAIQLATLDASLLAKLRARGGTMEARLSLMQEKHRTCPTGKPENGGRRAKPDAARPRSRTGEIARKELRKA